MPWRLNSNPNSEQGPTRQLSMSPHHLWLTESARRFTIGMTRLRFVSAGQKFDGSGGVLCDVPQVPQYARLR